MRKLLTTTTFLATAALVLAAGALAATPKANQYFAGKTAHKRYLVDFTSKCSTKKCTQATTVTVEVTAGSATNPKASGCPFSAYDLPAGKIKGGKFSSTTSFTVSSTTTLKFTVSGTFTAATTLSGTIAGPKACGGSDSFQLKATKAPKPPSVGATG